LALVLLGCSSNSYMTFSDKISPINLESFLNMTVVTGLGGKEVVNLDGKLKTIRDLVGYWNSERIQRTIDELSNGIHKETIDKTGSFDFCRNPQYINCMVAGFRHNVADHHEVGWDKMTKEYYDSLKPMSDKEIETYLRENPVEFDKGHIAHSYHRACAMVGRLIRGEKYIPFYVEEER
jgi:hypothetical protein